MADLRVVPFNDGRPTLNDITGRLRLLADQIDAGEHGDVTTLYVLIARGADYPTTFGYGPIDGANDPIIQFELAKTWHVQAMIGRLT